MAFLSKSKGKVVPVPNYIPRHRDKLRSRGVAPRILNLGIR